MNTKQDRLPIGTQVRFQADFRTWEGKIKTYTSGGRVVIDAGTGRDFVVDDDQLIPIGKPSVITPADKGLLAAKQDAVALEIHEEVIVNLTNMPAKVAMVSSDSQTVRVTFEDGHESIEVPAANVTRRPKSRFQYGDAVQMVAVGIPARVVGIPDAETLEVVYDDIFGIFRIPAQYTQLVEYETTSPKHQFKVGTRVKVGSVDVPATVVGFNGNDYRVSYDDMPLDDKGYPFTVPARNVTLLEDPNGMDALLKVLSQRDAQIRELERQIAEAAQQLNVQKYALRQITTYHGSRYTDDADVMREIAEAALDGENITPRR
ncbi:MAG: hypothetical protein K8L91_08665 [Anaerolineae bacterium]|nr:hypothetical protein [Anaerolineae bacterium]